MPLNGTLEYPGSIHICPIDMSTITPWVLSYLEAPMLPSRRCDCRLSTGEHESKFTNPVEKIACFPAALFNCPAKNPVKNCCDFLISAALLNHPELQLDHVVHVVPLVMHVGDCEMHLVQCSSGLSESNRGSAEGTAYSGLFLTTLG